VVIVQSDNPHARLQTQGPLKWQDVCVAPCRVPVNPAGLYRIGGGTIRPSDTFNMPRPAGQVVVRTEVGSNVKHWVGIALIIGGVVDAAAGGIYYSSASSLANSSSNTAGMSKDYFQAVGIVGIISGVILLAVGIPLAMSSTSVEVR
jgi:predicted permease